MIPQKRFKNGFDAGNYGLFPQLHPERQPRGDRKRAPSVGRLVRGRCEVQGVHSAGLSALDGGGLSQVGCARGGSKGICKRLPHRNIYGR